jgi:uncharacterized protein YecE (DUF72 family)
MMEYARADRGEVLVGTSGWNYPPSEYGSWTGIFYPWKQGQKIPGTARKFDELAYYAERFRTVEINNTFYRPPSAKTAASWVARTPAGFRFSLKLYQLFTHKQEATRADIDEFVRGLDPLAEADKLGALLCQFPASFKRDDASVEYLNWLLHAFSPYSLAVELRHRSWSDEFGETITLLNEHGAAFVQIDEPKFRTSIRQNQLPNITSFYYLRAHGRNAEKWWRHEEKGERYDYLYSAEEIREFSGTLDAVRDIVPTTYAYLNNHPNARALANALQIRVALGELVDASQYPELIAHYPALRGIMAPAKSRMSERDGIPTPIRTRVRE